MVALRWGSVSITGNYRDNNEDRCLVDPDGRFFIVADGMGGQAAGERASELAVESVSDRLQQSIDFTVADEERISTAVDEAVSHANMEIMALGEIEPDCHNMGTTIVLMVVAGGELYIGGIGDSRVYLLRDGSIEQLTVDHSITQALVEAGTITPEEAETHRYKNMLYRYLGNKEGSNGVEVKGYAPFKNDQLVLCSDGVTDGIADDVIKSLLLEHSDPQEAAEAIVDAAVEGGSKDNITCVVVQVD